MISDFFKTPSTFSAHKLANECNCQVVGDKNARVNNVAILKNAQANELSFCGNSKYLEDHLS